MKRYLLVGNYGAGNLGDEALKEYFLSRFQDVTWLVLSSNPAEREVPRLPFGFRSLFAPWWKTLFALRKCDGVVFGGGSLFTDTESLGACALWGWHALITRLFRKPLFLAFQGVGPFRTVTGAWIARKVFLSARFVSVRDNASLCRVQTWGVDAILSADPVLSLIPQGSSAGSGNVLAVIPRENSGEVFYEKATQLFRSRMWDGVAIFTLRPDSPQEAKVAEQLARIVSARVVPVTSIKDLISVLSSVSFVLSQRYHGSLVALALGKEVISIPQGEGDKLSTLPSAQDMGSLRHAAIEGERKLREALR